MAKDLTPKKTHKDLILAAIELLKAKGHDINPYTVADEAGIPRSTLYRSTEYMEILKEARGDKTRPGDSSTEGLQNQILEAEHRIKQLEEEIWKLEADNEKLAKEKQESWNHGFQSGREDTLRLLKGTAAAAGLAVDSQQPVAAAESNPQPVPASRSETAPLPQEQFQPPVLAQNEQKSFDHYAGSTSADGVFNAARSGPFVAGNYSPLVELSWRDVETVYNYAAANLKDLADQIADVTSSGKAQDLAVPPAGDSSQWQDPAASAPVLGAPLSTSSSYEPSEQAMEAYRKYAYTVASEPAVAEGVFDGSKSGASSGALEPGSWFASDESLTHFEPSSEVPQEILPQNSWEQPSPAPGAGAIGYQFGTEAKESSLSDIAQQHYQSWSASQQLSPEIFSAQKAPEQQPSEVKRQSYLDLTPPDDVEPAPAAGRFGAPVQELSSDAQFTAQQFEDLQARDQQAREKGRKTEDRLQAFSDPRDFSESEAVVDLDELDIFDDLDDYVDLDKIEIIRDVEINPVTEEEKTAGDELRELIKGRIKQAADISVESGIQRTALGAAAGTGAAAGAGSGGGDKGSAAGGMGARNKFVGGKAQTVEAAASQTAAAQQSFVPKIPPEMRRHCMILGIPADPEQLTKDRVMTAWKNQIASPGVHPDLGGDTEAAIALNTAKDVLVRWLEAQAPKLGKKFGGGGGPGGGKPTPPQP